MVLQSWQKLTFTGLFSVAATSCVLLNFYVVGSLNRTVTVSRRGLRYEPSWVYPDVELWIPQPKARQGLVTNGCEPQWLVSPAREGRWARAGRRRAHAGSQQQ